MNKEELGYHEIKPVECCGTCMNSYIYVSVIRDRDIPSCNLMSREINPEKGICTKFKMRGTI